MVNLRIRWWPLVAIAVVIVLGLVWNWTYRDVQRQDRHIFTALVLIGGYLLTLLWVLFLSRMARCLRCAVAGFQIGAVALAAIFLRIEEITGDFLPVFEWRWADRDEPRGESTPDLVPSSTGIRSASDSPKPPGSHYPQFLGPQRNATVAGPDLYRDWDTREPELVWRRAIGEGWSGFAVVGRYAITQEQHGDSERVVAYDRSTGEILWSQSDVVRYESFLAGVGPRATPTISGGRVYALGATGILSCFDLATGERVWRRDIVEDNGSAVPDWGYSGSPLVLSDLVVICAGGQKGRSLVAYDKATGEFAWGSGDEPAHYSSPLLANLVGIAQLMIFNAGGIYSHFPDDGRLLWQYPWKRDHPHVAMPVLLPEDRVLISSGYGHGSELLRVHCEPDGQWWAERVWKSLRLKAKFTNVVYYKGHIYGLDDGVMVCLDAEDGTLRWKEGRYGHGQVILVDPLMIVMAETGEVVLLELDHRQSRVVSRFQALDGKSWNPPALAGASLLVRNHREAACFRLPLVGETTE